MPGLYIIGALAGYPLIKQAMNQGFEVIEHLLGRVVAPADHDILAAKFRILRGGQDVERMVSQIRKGLPLFREVQTLALRELLLVSRIVTPAKGAAIFARGDYRSSIFNIMKGEVRLEADGGSPMILRGGQLLGEMSLVSGRPHETSAWPERIASCWRRRTAQSASCCEPRNRYAATSTRCMRFAPCDCS